MRKITCFIVTLCFEEIVGSSRERNFAYFFKSNHNIIISRFFKNSKTLIHALRHILQNFGLDGWKTYAYVT